MRKHGEEKMVSDFDEITDELPMNSASLLELSSMFDDGVTPLTGSDEGPNTCISICGKFFCCCKTFRQSTVVTSATDCQALPMSL